MSLQLLLLGSIVCDWAVAAVMISASEASSTHVELLEAVSERRLPTAHVWLGY